ncbi:hypothetical protein EYC84_002500 [Monilinia fructicola]|uniref:Uncharacterized protein n=1 Tax=Monilinia fructicola TaxID=38448 RepID=A0A5M9JQS6_MONFR|nr:hypothetical protein EYC84_002500 [Monilinia fructicola]
MKWTTSFVAWHTCTRSRRWMSFLQFFFVTNNSTSASNEFMTAEGAVEEKMNIKKSSALTLEAHGSQVNTHSKRTFNVANR